MRWTRLPWRAMRLEDVARRTFDKAFPRVFRAIGAALADAVDVESPVPLAFALRAAALLI